MLRRVALVRTDVSEELSDSFIRVTKIGEVGTTLAVISNRRIIRITKFRVYEYSRGISVQRKGLAYVY
jgi:DNA-binding TFAR19-related protein (PDSD5 family)